MKVTRKKDGGDTIVEKTMSILAVIGSARKGNTYKTVKTIEENLKLLGNVNVEYLFLKEVDLKGCIGCTNCLVRGEDICPLKDERESIEQKMLHADGLIFASPNYVCNVSSLMKNFIDRFAYCGHRPRFFTKPAMLVCTSAGPGGLNACMNSLSSIATAGFQIVNKLKVITPLYKLSDSITVKNQNNIIKESKRFYETVQKPSMKTPTLLEIMKFQAVRTFLLCRNDYLPCDYTYWKDKGWLDKEDYFYPISKKVIKIVFGRLIGKFCIVYYKNVLLKGVEK